MRFRKLAIAALILSMAAIGSLAAYQVADLARDEAAQTTIDRNDSLAVEPNITQKLVSYDDHDPTSYGDTVDVTYNGTAWTNGTDYAYYDETGELEFLRDEPDEANISYQYEIPENQVADDQLQTATKGFGNVMLAAVGLAFVSLFLFIAGFVANKMGVGRSQSRSRTGR